MAHRLLDEAGVEVLEPVAVGHRLADAVDAFGEDEHQLAALEQLAKLSRVPITGPAPA